MDSYMHQVDQTLCSNNCTCSGIGAGNFAIQFQECTSETQEVTYNNTIAQNPNFDSNGSFESAAFFSYMNKVELNLNCTGICYNNYESGNIFYSIQKYLFSDISR